MRSSHGITLIAAALALSACGGARGTPDTTPATTTAPVSAASTAEIEAIYRARMDSARARFSPADVRFVTGMIGHHAQAIVMANLVPTRTNNASLHVLAGRIINAQNDEIALMQRWLRDRRQPVPEVHIEGTSLMVHGADHAQHMPGMLTPVQLKQLEQARGTDFDRLFLTFMIQHHRGAVTMVRELFATDGAAQEDTVFKLATDVQVDQTTEIARMEQMLAALPPGGVR